MIEVAALPTQECEIPHCDREAHWEVHNTGTGKKYKMCSLHMNGYNRDPMIVEEIDNGTS